MSDDLAPPKIAAPTKPKPVLYVQFTGGDISPERVSLSTLSQTLNAIRQLSSTGEPHHAPAAGEPADPGTFQLVGVKKGSAVYAFGGQSSGLQRLRAVGQVLDDPVAARDVDFSIRAIAELSSVSARLRCRIAIFGKLSEGKPVVLAKIGPATSRHLRETLFIEGETSIFGTVKRVGGVTRMRCSVRIPSQDRLLYCRVEGGDLSRRLGKHLYEDVLLTGKATWLRSSWRIVEFVVKSVSQPKQGNIVEAFDELRKAGGSAWDRIDDPEAFLDPDRSEG
jgi:hypothetical protein